MKYAIHAYEQIYGGLHGIYSDFVVEVDSELDAQEAAAEASRDVMFSYSCIMDAIYEEAENFYGSEADDSIEFNTHVNDAMDENIAYDICRIRDDAPNDIGNMEYEDFIEQYRFME